MNFFRSWLLGYFLAVVSGLALFVFGPAEISILSAAICFFSAFAAGRLFLKKTDFCLCIAVLSIILLRFFPPNLPLTAVAGFAAAGLFNRSAGDFQKNFPFSIGWLCGAVAGILLPAGFLYRMTVIFAVILILLHMIPPPAEKRWLKISSAIFSIIVLSFFPARNGKQPFRDFPAAFSLIAALQPNMQNIRIFSAGINCNPTQFRKKNTHSIRYMCGRMPMHTLNDLNSKSMDLICCRLTPPLSLTADLLLSAESLLQIRRCLSDNGVFALCIHIQDNAIAASAAELVRPFFKNVIAVSGISTMIFASNGNQLSLVPEELSRRAKCFFSNTWPENFFPGISPLVGKTVVQTQNNQTPSQLYWKYSTLTAVCKSLIRHRLLLLLLSVAGYTVFRYFFIGSQRRKTGILFFENGFWTGGVLIMLAWVIINKTAMTEFFLPIAAGILLFARSAFKARIQEPNRKRIWLTVRLLIPVTAAAAMFLTETTLVLAAVMLCAAAAGCSVLAEKRCRKLLTEPGPLPECATAGLAAAIPVCAFLLVQPDCGLWITTALLTILACTADA